MTSVLVTNSSPPSSTRTKRKVTNGNLCGCTGGCAHTRSTTLPRTGDQSFEVPVTAWGYRGWDLGFSLTYHSVGTVDPTVPEANNFARLSEGNSKWTHTFAQWVEVVDTGGNGIRAVWYNGSGTQAFRDGGSGNWISEDSDTTMQSGGAAISRPSGASVPQSWFKITDADGTVYQFENVYWYTDTSLPADLPFYGCDSVVR